jgi:hypothetical protein
MNDIDYRSRYELLVGLCRELAFGFRASRDKETWPELVLKLIATEEKIDRKLVEWQEMEPK